MFITTTNFFVAIATVSALSPSARAPMATAGWAAELQRTASASSVHRVRSASSFAGEPLTFVDFIQKHGRTYEEGTEEYEHRRALFQKRLEEANRWNSGRDRLWTAGINHLSDWTEAELKTLRGLRPVASGHSSGTPTSFLQVASRHSALAALPEESLWNETVLGQVENQGECGSCWAVAAAKMAEANHRIHTGRSRGFSAQQLVDCVPNPRACGGKGGCDGATVELAMIYMAHEGLADSLETPYVGQDTQCKAPPQMTMMQQTAVDRMSAQTYGVSMEELVAPGVKPVEASVATNGIRFVSWERLPENQYEPLMMALMEGVVAVSVAASDWAWYHGGIFNLCDRDAEIDHAVVATGFGVDRIRVRPHKFWRILNSWGDEWGEHGSIRLYRTDHDGEYCGTDYHPEVGTACKGGPKEVKVCGACGILYDSVLARFGGHAPSDVEKAKKGLADLLATLELSDLQSGSPRSTLMVSCGIPMVIVVQFQCVIRFKDPGNC